MNFNLGLNFKSVILFTFKIAIIIIAVAKKFSKCYESMNELSARFSVLNNLPGG